MAEEGSSANANLYVLLRACDRCVCRGVCARACACECGMVCVCCWWRTPLWRSGCSCPARTATLSM
jgi:hypothetical protein